MSDALPIVRVFVVSDDRDLSHNMVEALCVRGYQAIACTGTQASVNAPSGRDAILVDVSRSDGSGASQMRRCMQTDPERLLVSYVWATCGALAGASSRVIRWALVRASTDLDQLLEAITASASGDFETTLAERPM
jgi:ActR/RegA family two-component response regulator